MRKARLTNWLQKWNALYDTSYDLSIAAYQGRKVLGIKEVANIYRWKYRGLWPDKKVHTLKSKVVDKQVRDWTRRALACSDDLGSLCIAGLLPGAGPGGASAILMAAEPSRFTVMDTRAIKSLAYLDRWKIVEQGDKASYWHWPAYLDECRRLAAISGLTLREIDRALYKSAGQP